MPRFTAGDKAADFELFDLEGRAFRLSSLAGKRYHLAFFRFASCPFCNLQRYATRHESPFPILADDGGVIHEDWGREISWIGVLKGMFGRLGTLMKRASSERRITGRMKVIIWLLIGWKPLPLG